MSYWVPLLVLFLCFSFNDISDARHRKQSAVIVGTVYCDTCFRREVSKSPHHFISGAIVAVECGHKGQKLSFRQEVKTKKNGKFKVKIPFSITKNMELIKKCSVQLIRSSEPYCSVAATATSSNIHFKSKKAGTHIFSAGFFTFKPELCSQKDFTEKKIPPSLPDPPAPFLPPIAEGLLPPLPIPDLPITPLVPPLPRLPGIPLLPPITIKKPSLKFNNKNKFSDQKSFAFPPNPFQPPSVLPPLPFQPSPPSLIPPLVPSPTPPALVPPLIPSPPPASLFPPLPGFPQIPGLFPSPSPIPLVPQFPPVPPTSGNDMP
ncbi:uncharacterized protein [Rutidosis leptorrhynchoides]|uniref:uncharacterized protein n=1 Tax=Rutidosis leptorrhynchoides TaxID=125765 RepID=UPI003A9926E5